MAFIGADVGQLRQLAQRFDDFGNQLESLAVSLSHVIANAEWSGYDSDEMSSHWDGYARAAMVSAAEALTAAGQLLARNANEQESTSSADSGAINMVHTAAGGGGERWDGSDRRDGDSRDSGDQRDSRDPGPGRRGEDGDDGDHDVPGNGSGYPGGLGTGVPGTNVDKPQAPPWSPPDEGAGEYDSEWAGPVDYATKTAAGVGANALEGSWPHAADNLQHFLGNSGDDRTQDVNAMLNDCPQLSGQVDADVNDMAAAAVERAKQQGATGPITFPVSTDWQGYYISPDESKDWYYASGGMAYSVQGQVTVYPPETPGGEWRYETDTSVSYRDRYNWDGGKETQIGPITVTDAQLAALHRAGIAQEYNMMGESDSRHTSGTAK